MRLELRVLSCLLALGVAACASNSSTTTREIPTCTSMAECAAYDGQRVHVVGVYTVWGKHPSGTGHRQAMVKFDPDDDFGPFLGAWRHLGHMRTKRERERYDGKTVRVTGRFLLKMPQRRAGHPDAQRLDGPCIHPVERIRIE